MRKSAQLTIGLLLVASSVLASNTGFKLNYNLRKGTLNNNWTAFPYFYYPDGVVGSVANSFSLCLDMNEGNVTPATKVLAVVRWDAKNDKPFSFNCGPSGFGNFAVLPGEAYSLKPPSDNIVVNIVGSHDDQYAPNKFATGGKSYMLRKGVLNNNWVSPPYHVISNNSFELCKDPGVNPNFPTNAVLALVRWDAKNDKPFSFNCGPSGFGAFPLVPGEGISMKPAADLTPVRMSVY